ncbi:MAG: hypothetical protein FWD73_03700 [Polyangiaceae bacterium]|nr:hypothetical protein [Polyangiaceae bacterium]
MGLLLLLLEQPAAMPARATLAKVVRLTSVKNFLNMYSSEEIAGLSPPIHCIEMH